MKTTEETKQYEIHGGIVTKHFTHYPEGTTLVHYTGVKNGKQSKKYVRLGDLTNWMDKN